MGTSVTPTQPAMTNAMTAEVAATAIWPSSAAAPEYSASRSAAVSAVMERKNARTAERSALAQSRAMVGSTLTREREQIPRYHEERNPWFPIFSAARRGANWRRRGAKKRKRQAV